MASHRGGHRIGRALGIERFDTCGSVGQRCCVVASRIGCKSRVERWLHSNRVRGVDEKRHVGHRNRSCGIGRREGGRCVNRGECSDGDVWQCADDCDVRRRMRRMRACINRVESGGPHSIDRRRVANTALDRSMRISVDGFYQILRTAEPVPCPARAECEHEQDRLPADDRLDRKSHAQIVVVRRRHTAVVLAEALSI
jgi:hypothetical protein